MEFTLLTGTDDSIAPTKARGLRSEDKPSVNSYIEAFKNYADDHCLWYQLNKVMSAALAMTLDQCKLSFDVINIDAQLII